MRKGRFLPWLRGAKRDAGVVLGSVGGLVRTEWMSSLVLGLGFAALPALLVFFSDLRVNSLQYSAYEFIINGVLGRMPFTEAVDAYISKMTEASTMSYYLGTNSWLLSLIISALLTPILQGALALIYHGRLEQGHWPMGQAVKEAASVWTRLVVVALTSFFATRFVMMLSSILSGLISAVVSIFTMIPYVGPVLIVLAGLLALIINAIATFAVTVLLCYIWQVTICEGLGGFGALVKSVYFTRADLKRTAVSLGALTLLRWGLTLALGLIWLALYAAFGTQLTVYMGITQVVDALFLILTAATAAVLYAQHPMRGGSGYQAPKDPRHLKSANIPGESEQTKE